MGGNKKAKVGHIQVDCTFSISPAYPGPTHAVHLKDPQAPGDYIGKSGTLVKRLMKLYGCPAKNHPLSYGGGKNNIAEGHHLICSASMDNKVWEGICYSFGYDINCIENGVMLPGSLIVACQARVPLHQSSHAKGKEILTQTCYTDYVSTKLDTIAKNAKDYCKKRDEMIDKLNNLSKTIWNDVKLFKLTLTWDGQFYEDGLPEGCMDAVSVGNELRQIKPCQHNRNHPAKLDSFNPANPLKVLWAPITAIPFNEWKEPATK